MPPIARFTFVVPLMAKAAANDWPNIERLFGQTMKSLLAQSDPRFEIIIVGTDRPSTLPGDRRVTWMSVPPKKISDWRDAINDAGHKRQVAAWEFGKRGAGYLMFVDADDLVNRDIVRHVRRHPSENGYVLRRGLAFDAKSESLARIEPERKDGLDFSRVCGTSSILKLSIDDVGIGPSDALTRYQRLYAEGHFGFEKALRSEGKSPGEIPFPGAVYVINTGDNISTARAAAESAKRRAQIRAVDACCASNPSPAQDWHHRQFNLESNAQPHIRVELSVCVITHGRPQGLERLLQSLMPLVAQQPSRELIVVNDGSHSDAYARVVDPFVKKLTYDVLAVNRGIPGARNAAARLAKGEFIVFIDDDCVPPPGWLDWIEARLIAHPEIDALGGTTLPLHPKRTTVLSRAQAFLGFFPRPRRIGRDVLFVTANLAIRRDCLLQLGGFFEPDDFAGAGEDTELSARLQLEGFRVMLDEMSVVEHDVGDGIRRNLRRYWRYGFGNGQFLLSPNAHKGLDDHRWLIQGRMRTELFHSWSRNWRALRGNKIGVFSALASTAVGTALHLAYVSGCKAGFTAARQRRNL